MNQLELHCDEIVVVEGRNPRLTLTGIEDLASSILENGVVTPIKVKVLSTHGKGTQLYELVDGHRRVAACQYLLETEHVHITIPALPVECKNEGEVLIQMMVSNDSEPFAPFEEAIMFKRLKEEFGYTTEQIAKHVGRSASHVSDKLALLRADPVVQEAVKEGSLSVSDANTIVRKSRGDAEVQRDNVQRVLEEGREAVIDKELKKGRMPKGAWEVATKTYDQVWQSHLAVSKDTSEPVLAAALADPDPVGVLDQLPSNKRDLIEFAFYLGKLNAFSEFSNLGMSELWQKLEERNNI